MVYRIAIPNDIDALAEMRGKQLAEEKGPVPPRDIGAEIGEYFRSAMADGSFIAWVAEDEGRLIATGQICFYRLPPTYTNPSGNIAYITGMYTSPEYRRRGIASRLLVKALDEAKTRGCATVRLHASEAGKPLYEKFGFKDSRGYMSLAFPSDG